MTDKPENPPALNDVRLVETCGACPEQYDAFIGFRQVGYLRLRHGYFYAAYPNVNGECVYEAHPRGDGIFEPDEREHYLNLAKAALLSHDAMLSERTKPNE